MHAQGNRGGADIPIVTVADTRLPVWKTETTGYL